MSVFHFVLLLLIGYAVFTLDKKQKNIPVPPVLICIGLGLSYFSYFNEINVTEPVLYDVFLPSLLFISAYQFSPKALKKNSGIIAVLSTAGLLLTAVLLGFFTYVVLGSVLAITLIGAMLVATILTPTDPVSVVSILKQSSDDPKTADIVEGESMINDGTSVVLFTVLLGMYTGTEQFSTLSFIGEFLYVSIGGIALGFLFGWIVSKAVHIMHNKQYQVMLSIILAYGGFHLAEHLGVSGVLATVASGLMLSWEFDHTNKEDHYRESLSGFWDVVEPSLLSIVFLLIGIEWRDHFSTEGWWLIIFLFLMSLVIRWLILAGTTRFYSKWRREFSWQEITLMSWSGIKGTMSVVLLLSLEAEAGQQANVLLSIGFGVIFLSLVIQSIGIYPLSQLLKKHS
ncbi:sodium:proton antiporter [Halobacillus fulvus]|nr:sodium:proton antiporter [Halobacillus fulvus]